MRRLGLAAVFALCALAGALAAVVLAGPSGATTAPATTDTTAATTTTAPPPTTTAPPTTTTTAPAVLADGVTIGGIEVGGLAPEAAFAIVRAAFEAPLTVSVAGSRLQPTPVGLGAIGYVQNAVMKARSAPPGTEVPLTVRVDGAKVRAYVAKVAARFDRKPLDSRLVLRNLRPVWTKEVAGRSLDRPAGTAAIVAALRANERFPVTLRFSAVRPAVTRANAGHAVVIRRGSNRLYLYRGAKLVRTFGVATGEARYPTPLGRFRVIVKWQNPWWYPPDSDWAKGRDPIPPGPGNPLGTRWMGIDSPGVGIHGTPDPGSIGYSVSHGCIRMAIPDAEWLFARIAVGTPVFIVRQ